MGTETDMSQLWLGLIAGLIIGWVIEWIIDWTFWRSGIEAAEAEEKRLRKRLEEAEAELEALRARLEEPSHAPSSTRTESDGEAGRATHGEA
ncbi:hypothetical protein RY27_16370 [Litorilinea aerophila]|nr:hypothetical protein RY27_16370 [Litorilinea aerophila]